MLEQTDIAVANLITKFNDVTPQLMETFKKQIEVAYTYDIIGITLGIIFLLVGFIGLVWAIKGFNAHEESSISVGVFSFFVIIIALITTIVIGLDLIQLNLNPDYYILQKYIRPLLPG